MSFVLNILSDDGESDVEFYPEEFDRDHQNYKKINPSQDTKHLDVSILTLFNPIQLLAKNLKLFLQKCYLFKFRLDNVGGSLHLRYVKMCIFWVEGHYFIIL